LRKPPVELTTLIKYKQNPNKIQTPLKIKLKDHTLKTKTEYEQFKANVFLKKKTI